MQETLRDSAIVIIAGIIIAFNPYKLFDSTVVGIFLTAIGIIYGVLAAFMISNSSSRFQALRNGISEETNSLIALAILSKRISYKKFYQKMHKAIKDYCSVLISSAKNWSEIEDTEKIYKALREVTKTAADTPLKTTKDQNIFSIIESEAQNLSSVRQNQLLLLETRTSNTEWALIIFFSLYLLFLINFMQLTSTYLLSLIVVAGMNISILLIPVVLYRMDFLAIYEGKVAVEPYKAVVDNVLHDV